MKRLFLLIFIIQACSYSKPLVIEGLDVKAFKSDRGSCNNTRSTQIEVIKKNKNLFLEISENEIIKALGRYDYQGLGRRNEKTFVYFLEKGDHCQNIQNKTSALSLILHFNSVGLVKEVQIETGGIAQ